LTIFTVTKQSQMSRPKLNDIFSHRKREN